MNADIPKSSIANYVRNLALTHHVVYTRTQGDAWAEDVTRLAGDDVVTDEVEDMIIALKRAKVIDTATMVQLLGDYLEQKRF